MKVAFFLAKYVSLLLLTLLLAAAVRGACQQDFLLLLRQTFVENLTATVCTPWFALTAGILLLMGLLRGVTAIWNMTYTLGLTLLVFLICLALLGPTYTLPGPLSELPQLSFLSSTEQDYPALLYLVPIAAVLGAVSTLTWISGGCWVLLWLVSIFWAFPIKRKIRALNRQLKAFG